MVIVSSLVCPLLSRRGMRRLCTQCQPWGSPASVPLGTADLSASRPLTSWARDSSIARPRGILACCRTISRLHDEVLTPGAAAWTVVHEKEGLADDERDREAPDRAAA